MRGLSKEPRTTRNKGYIISSQKIASLVISDGRMIEDDLSKLRSFQDKAVILKTPPNLYSRNKSGEDKIVTN